MGNSYAKYSYVPDYGCYDPNYPVKDAGLCYKATPPGWTCTLNSCQPPGGEHAMDNAGKSAKAVLDSITTDNAAEKVLYTGIGLVSVGVIARISGF